MNYLKTGILLILLTILFVVAGGMMAGPRGAQVALVVAVIMNFGSYWFSDRIVLAMCRAKPVTQAEAPVIYGIVRELAQEAGIPMPKLYVMPQAAPNAFATGRGPGHASVCVTEGLLKVLDREELKGVLAHELSHVIHRDILIMSIAATIAGAIMMLTYVARFGAFAGGSSGDRDRDGGNILGTLAIVILAPLAASLIQLAISRSREYAADAGAAKLARDPRGLANALRKIEASSRYVQLDVAPQTAHLFIASPLKGMNLTRIFSTHPPIEERIRRLEATVL